MTGISPDAEPDPKRLGDPADLSNDERRRADDYFSIMERNLARIVDALGCRAASP